MRVKELLHEIRFLTVGGSQDRRRECGQLGASGEGWRFGRGRSSRSGDTLLLGGMLELLAPQLCGDVNEGFLRLFARA
jgi:hypothetical protein